MEKKSLDWFPHLHWITKKYKHCRFNWNWVLNEFRFLFWWEVRKLAKSEKMVHDGDKFQGKKQKVVGSSSRKKHFWHWKGKIMFKEYCARRENSFMPLRLRFFSKNIESCCLSRSSNFEKKMKFWEKFNLKSDEGSRKGKLQDGSFRRMFDRQPKTDMFCVIRKNISRGKKCPTENWQQNTITIWSTTENVFIKGAKF